MGIHFGLANLWLAIDRGRGRLKLKTKGEDEAVVRFVRRFCTLPIRATDQRTTEFFALVNEALDTGAIDTRLQVITSPRLSAAFADR